MNIEKEKYWTGEVTNCNICHKAIEGSFVDGATSFGPWAIMCKYCYPHFGRGLGLGKGQRYIEQPDGRWLKSEG